MLCFSELIRYDQDTLNFQEGGKGGREHSASRAGAVSALAPSSLGDGAPHVERPHHQVLDLPGEPLLCFGLGEGSKVLRYAMAVATSTTGNEATAADGQADYQTPYLSTFCGQTR